VLGGIHTVVAVSRLASANTGEGAPVTKSKGP